jgi:MFS family permease
MNEAASPNNRTPITRWYVVALLVAYSYMTWFNRVSMSVAYTEQIKGQTDIEPVAMGWVYSAFLIAYTIFMTPGGWLIDRCGPWFALVIMGFGSALFGALTGLTGMPTLISAGWMFLSLLTIRTVMGVFTAPIYPAASRTIADWIPPGQRILANGFVQGAAAVGIASTFHLFGSLMDFVGWQTAFLISGAVTGLLALVWTISASDHPRRQAKPDDASLPSGRSSAAATPWYTLLHNRNLMLLTLSYAAVGYVEYLFFFWAQYYFQDVLELPKEEGRTYSMILTLALAGGMIAGGWLADRLRTASSGRWSRIAVPMIGLAASGGFLLIGVRCEGLTAMVTLLSLALVAIGAAEAPTWTLAVELGGQQGGTAAAVCNTSGNAIGLIAPILTPAVAAWITAYFDISERIAWQWAISLGSAIAVVGAMLWCFITPASDRVESTEERGREAGA